MYRTHPRASIREDNPTDYTETAAGKPSILWSISRALCVIDDDTVFPVLIGSSRARTSPGLSATLPYEGRDQATSAALGALILAPLSSEERGWG